MLSRRKSGFERQSGQVVVLFALLIPLFLVLGAVVLDVGNWYVHKRHLQTQVDAAALAGGGVFSGCFSNDPNFVNLTNSAIRTEAAKYAGDDLRAAAASVVTRNRQIQEPGDVRVALNSSTYWSPSNGYNASTYPAYGLDDTIATPGDPCSRLELDVKATDDRVSNLWGVSFGSLFPLHPSPKSHARVEIQQGEGVSILPWAFPEVDPQAVVPIFIDEETGEVLCVPGRPNTTPPLAQTSPPPPLSQFNVWEGDVGCDANGSQFNVSSQNIGVIVLISKVTTPNLPAIGASPPYTCNDAPRRWNCYAGSTGDGSSSLSFIHGYDDDNAPKGQIANPIVQDVQLTPGTCASSRNLSAPYFVLEGPCNVGVQAVIDFGPGALPPTPPNGFPTCAIVEVAGNPMTWNPGGIGGSLGTWTTSGSPIGLADASGRTVISLDWWSGPKSPPNPPVACGNGKNQRPNNGSFPKVAAPYMADNDPSDPTDSGPVQLVKLTMGGGQANSLPDGPGPLIHVTVGLRPALTAGQLVGLRLSSDNPGSKTQAIDCDKNIKFEDEIANGCRTPYVLNYKDWDSNPVTPNTWRDIECLSYDQSAPVPPSPGFRYTLPVDAPYDPSPRPDCARLEPGVRNGDFGKGMHTRFENPCTDVHYPYPGNPTGGWATPQEEELDPRWVTIVVTDATAFEGAGASPGDTIPVKILGRFYVGGWTAVAQATGCPQNVPPPAGVGNKPNRGDVWGWFAKGVQPGGEATGKLCDRNDLGVCVAVLVE